MRARGVVAIAAVTGLGGLLLGSFAARAQSSITNSTFEPLSPARILDTRDAGQPLGTDAQIDVQVVGQGGLPANATAVVLNLTVTEPDASSFLTLWPAGELRPQASNINFVAGRTIANLVTVKLSADGRISIYNFNGNTHVVVDVNGYYHPAVLGAPGPVMRSGSGPPGANVGNSGDFYLDTAASRVYGPKNGSTWPAAGNPGLAGYEIVSPGTGTVPRVATCPAGKRVIGGGGLPSITQSYPVGNNAWATNGTTTYAICVTA